ncbi:MAG TPA: NUDIX domain-containing protein [Thermoanaerobaculia bacterium]|nr:NUDIX domain-containing protein [Thermoanaerobaculia bacterium]
MSELSELSQQSWILEVRQRLALPRIEPGAPGVDGGGNGGGGNGLGTGSDGDRTAEAAIAVGAASGAATPGAAAVTAPPGAAALVPLYVDAGQLWTLLTERVAPRRGLTSSLAFPGSQVVEGEEPWEAARRGAQVEAGLDPQVLLELGTLAPVTTPAGLSVLPCVAALPEAAVRKREDPAAEAGVADVVPFPLRALAAPNLIEGREVMLGDQVQQLAIYHVGRHRYWGVTAALLEELLVRLGLGAPVAPG